MFVTRDASRLPPKPLKETGDCNIVDDHVGNSAERGALIILL